MCAYARILRGETNMEMFAISVGDWTQKGNSWTIKSPKANLVFMTGMQEHSERYDDMAKYLNNFGINVYVLDAVGQGLNAPKVEDQQKWFKNAFDTNVTAAHEKIVQLKKDTGLPTYLMGHSMGSFMTQRYLELFPDSADKVVIWSSNGPARAKMAFGFCAASLVTNKKNWDKPSPFLTNASFGSYVKSVKNRKTDLDWLSVNEENVKNYIDDPYCGAPNTHGFWKEFLRGMNELYKKKNLKKVSKKEKILIVAGEEDPVGEMGKGPRRLKKMYNDLGLKDVQIHMFKNMRHEIHNETDKHLVFKVLSDFLAE